MRFAECTGQKGTASFNVNLPNSQARLTNFLGEGDELVNKGSGFTLQLNPQQIVTVRFKVDESIEQVSPTTDWTPLVPESKRAFLIKYNQNTVGHPPRK